MSHISSLTQDESGQFRKTDIYEAGMAVFGVRDGSRTVGVVYRSKAETGPQVLPWNGAIFRTEGDFRRLLQVCSVKPDEEMLAEGRTRAASQWAREEASGIVVFEYEHAMRCPDCDAILSTDKITDAIRLMGSLSREDWVTVVAKSADYKGWLEEQP